MKLVKGWVPQSRVLKNNDLQVSPRLEGQFHNQVSSFCVWDRILCRDFDPTEHRVHFLQQVVPESLLEEFLGSIQFSSTGRHLGVAKVTEKISERFYWTGFQEDINFLPVVVPNVRNELTKQKHIAILL